MRCLLAINKFIIHLEKKKQFEIQIKLAQRESDKNDEGEYMLVSFKIANERSII